MCVGLTPSVEGLSGTTDLSYKERVLSALRLEEL